MREVLFIPILLGTRLEGSQSGKVARWLLEQAKNQSGLETKLFDTSEFNFPSNLAGEAMKPFNQEWQQAVERADGLIIVSPEYNHGYPGTLKLALDILYEEYRYKAVAICSVSSGPIGGARMIENLLPILRDFHLAISNNDLRFANVEAVFNDKGELLDQRYLKRAETFLQELIWLAKTMKWGRQHHD